MTIALVDGAHCTTGNQSVASQTLTTDGFTTTGASLIIAVYVAQSNAPATSVTDNQTPPNTYTSVARYNPNNGAYPELQLYYCLAPEVGTQPHTVSMTFGATSAARYVGAAAFSGIATTAALDSDHDGSYTATGVSVNSQQPGDGITPSANGELLIAALGRNIAETPSIDNSFSVIADCSQSFISANKQDGKIAYLVQSAASAINPTWSWTTASRAVNILAGFKGAVGESYEDSQDEAVDLIDETETVQIKAPLTIVDNTGLWTPSTGLVLVSTIDDAAGDSGADTDYISSPNDPSAASCEFLFYGADAWSGGFGIVSYRARCDGGTGSLTVGLYDGSTLIKEWTHATLETSFTRYDQFVSSDELSGVDPADLRLRFTAG